MAASQTPEPVPPPVGPARCTEQPALQRMDVVFPEIDFGIDDVPDLHERMAALREAGHRVVPVRYIGGVAWLILRYDDVAAAYMDDDGLPAAAAYRRHSEPVQGRTLLSMSGDEHRVNRLLVSKAFQPAAIRAMVESLLLPLANELVDAMQGETEVDLVEAYTHRYPFSVIARMLGIPTTDHDRLVAWVDGLFSFPWDPEAALRASRERCAGTGHETGDEHRPRCRIAIHHSPITDIMASRLRSVRSEIPHRAAARSRSPGTSSAAR